MNLRWLIGLWAVAASGCGGSLSWPVSVTGAASQCGPGVDPLHSASQIELRLTSPGGANPSLLGLFDPAQLPASVDVSGFKEVLVVLEARGLDSSSKVVSFGRSLPFVPVTPSATSPAPVARVVLREVGVWAQASTTSGCLALGVARAGHTATLLADGRVLIAGGYRLEGTGRAPLSEVELYDPVSQTLADGPRMALSNGMLLLPRTAHTATRLPNGQVLVVGGEIYTPNVFSQVLPLASALMFDPPSNRWGVLAARTDPPSTPRSRQVAIADASGRVVIAGGLSRSASNTLGPEPSVEWFDPATNTLNVINGLQLPRTDLVGAAVQGAEVIALAGGATDAGVSSSVDLLRFTGGQFVRDPVSLELAIGRRGAAAFARGDDLALVGGYVDPVLPNPAPSTEVVLTRGGVSGEGPRVAIARGEACVVASSRAALMVGGRTGPGAAPVGALDVFSFDDAGAFDVASGPALPQGRVMHACTWLHDGSLLVVGGLFEQGAQQQVLDDLWLFMPPPAD